MGISNSQAKKYENNRTHDYHYSLQSYMENKDEYGLFKELDYIGNGLFRTIDDLYDPYYQQSFVVDLIINSKFMEHDLYRILEKVLKNYNVDLERKDRFGYKSVLNSLIYHKCFDIKIFEILIENRANVNVVQCTKYSDYKSFTILNIINDMRNDHIKNVYELPALDIICQLFIDSGAKTYQELIY